MLIPSSNVEILLSEAAADNYTLTLTSSGLKKNVRIEIENDEAEFNDNFFDVDAGIPRVVRITSHLPKELIKERLRLRML